MITIRAGNGSICICLLLLLTGCSREQQDWRSAEAADTIDGYGQFIQRHPESELVTQARMRVAQLGEDRDWQHAGSADTVGAYRDFLAQHPNGKWAPEARIRIENFSLGEQTGTDAASRVAAGNGTRAAAARADAARPGNGGHPDAGGSGNAGTHPDAGASGNEVANPQSGGSGKAGANPESGGARGLAAPGEAAVPAARLASAVGGSMGGGPSGGGMSASGAHGAVQGPSGSLGTGAGGAMAGGGASRPAASAQANGFGIQLGAFSNEAAANNEWRLLTGRFGPELQGLQEHVVAAVTPSGRVYRLQAVVGDEARARGICDSLRKRSQGCVAVLPH